MERKLVDFYVRFAMIYADPLYPIGYDEKECIFYVQ